MSSLLGPYMDDCRPEYADRVATDFPDLKVVIQHGGWPYALEAIGAAYKQPNIFIVPGQYVHYGFPGSDLYITALRHLLQDQLLFGSVYPNCGPLPDLRRIVTSWQLPASVERKYLRENAERILGL
jgi:predicted TIM-barrel fold metal-dependent hydrolase